MEPSYTSQSHIWKGAAPSLKKKARRTKKEPEADAAELPYKAVGRAPSFEKIKKEVEPEAK